MSTAMAIQTRLKKRSLSGTSISEYFVEELHDARASAILFQQPENQFENYQIVIDVAKGHSSDLED